MFLVTEHVQAKGQPPLVRNITQEIQAIDKDSDYRDVKSVPSGFVILCVKRRESILNLTKVYLFKSICTAH